MGAMHDYGHPQARHATRHQWPQELGEFNEFNNSMFHQT
jgi:hypothetical protein